MLSRERYVAVLDQAKTRGFEFVRFQDFVPGARALPSVQEDLEDGAIARAPQPEVARRPADDDLSGIGFAYRRKR